MSLKTATSVFGLVAMGLSTSGGRAALADSDYFQPGNLLLSRALYDNNPNNVQKEVTQLPPNCAAANCMTAISDGTYPYVWNNDTVDGSFGITAKIILDQLTPSGVVVNSLEVPNSSQNGVPPTKDQMVTSFSSNRLRKKVLRGCRYATLIQIRGRWRKKDSIEPAFGFLCCASSTYL